MIDMGNNVMVYESIDYGSYDTYHGGLSGIHEKIQEHCNEKYGYGNYSIEDYDVDITINATIQIKKETQ